MTMTVVRSVVRAQSNAFAELVDRGDLARFAAEGDGVGDEIDTDLASRCCDVTPQVVERLAPLSDLEAFDHCVAAVVAQHDDHLVPRQHRRVEVAVEHQVRAVADEHDRVAVGLQFGTRHRRSPPAGQLVAHAGEPVLTIERRDAERPPAVVQLAGKPTRCGEGVIALRGPRPDRPDDLGVRRQPGTGFAEMPQVLP